MKYEIIELEEEEIKNKVNAIDLDALIEKMGNIKIDAKSRCVSLVHCIMEPEGDTIYQLDVKPKGDGVEIFAKETHFEEYECFDEDGDEFIEDEGEYVTNQIHTYLGGERWKNLYKLLIKETNALRELECKPYSIDEYFLYFNIDEYSLYFDSDKIATSTTALAIFKEFVEGVGEEKSDSVFFEIGYRSVYSIITDYLYETVEITEE